MAETSREQLLREEFVQQTARIHWHELQTYYAHGNVVRVDGSLDLIEVAVQLGMDNKTLFEQWLAAGTVGQIEDAQARTWYSDNQELWAVVAAPWVLVQQRS